MAEARRFGRRPCRRPVSSREAGPAAPGCASGCAAGCATRGAGRWRRLTDTFTREMSSCAHKSTQLQRYLSHARVHLDGSGVASARRVPSYRIEMLVVSVHVHLWLLRLRPSALELRHELRPRGFTTVSSDTSGYPTSVALTFGTPTAAELRADDRSAAHDWVPRVAIIIRWRPNHPRPQLPILPYP